MNEINLIVFVLAAFPLLMEEKKNETDKIFQYIYIMLISGSTTGILIYFALFSSSPPLRYLLSLFIAASAFSLNIKIFRDKFPAEGGLLLFYIAASASFAEIDKSGMLIELIMIPVYFVLYLLILISVYVKINRFASRYFKGLPLMLIITGFISVILRIFQ